MTKRVLDMVIENIEKSKMESAKVETIKKQKECKMQQHAQQEQKQELYEVQKIAENAIIVNHTKYIDRNTITSWFWVIKTLLDELDNPSDAVCSWLFPQQILMDDSYEKTKTEFTKWLHNVIRLKYNSLFQDTFTGSEEEKILLKKADACSGSNCAWFFLFVIYRDFFKTQKSE